MKAIVLAAGKGTRLMSEKFNLPKVLREALGKPLIGHVLENIDFIDKKDTTIVIGYMADKVKEYLGDGYGYALQAEQKGTGHAVMMAADNFADYDGDVIILYGDMPLLKKETYQAIIDTHRKNNASFTLLTTVTDDKLAYGRIKRDENGSIIGIVEQKDASAEELLIKELNVGIYVANAKELFSALKNLKNDNAQGEYYLTDIPKLFIAEGKKVIAHTIYDSVEIFGVNTIEDLAFCEEVLSK